ncbi:MAG TPA: hypothetical protein VNX46_07580, partial [Candidatus Acidoferrum sp.]|nr:hypothetical protein [Candidatus Acidoferrum sp.]
MVNVPWPNWLYHFLYFGFCPKKIKKTTHQNQQRGSQQQSSLQRLYEMFYFSRSVALCHERGCTTDGERIASQSRGAKSRGAAIHYIAPWLPLAMRPQALEAAEQGEPPK